MTVYRFGPSGWTTVQWSHRHQKTNGHHAVTVLPTIIVFDLIQY